jgi:hypothetical protein
MWFYSNAMLIGKYGVSLVGDRSPSSVKIRRNNFINELNRPGSWFPIIDPDNKVFLNILSAKILHRSSQVRSW